MSESLNPAQGRWALAAALPFLLSIGLLGFAISEQVLVAFAIGWPILQIIGYVGSIKLAKGDFTHYLVKTLKHYQGVCPNVGTNFNPVVKWPL